MSTSIGINLYCTNANEYVLHSYNNEYDCNNNDIGQYKYVFLYRICSKVCSYVRGSSIFLCICLPSLTETTAI